MWGAGQQTETPAQGDIISRSLDKLWQIFIQPQRSLFDKSRLGAGRFRVDPHPSVYTRTDGKCPNLRGEEIEYTLLQAEEQKPETKGCCVVYLHSHGSSRAEGLALLQSVGSQGLDLCLFDFAGSGYSGGEYCSLGIREAGDIKIVLDCLRIRHSKSRFVLYGRSMGAAATIFLASQASAGLEMLILDSPFCDVEQLVQDLGRHYAGGIGGFFGFAFFSSVQGEITKRLGFDPSIIKPIQVCHNIRTPTIIIGGNEDEMVSSSRLEEMLAALSSKEKSFLRVDGNHSAARPQQFLDALMKKCREKFLKAVVRDRKEQENEQELLLERVEVNTIPSFQSKVSLLTKNQLKNEDTQASNRIDMVSSRKLFDDPNKSPLRVLEANRKAFSESQVDIPIPHELRAESGAKKEIQVPESTAPNLILTEKEELDSLKWRPPQIFGPTRDQEDAFASMHGRANMNRQPPGIFDSPKHKPISYPIFSPSQLRDPENSALHRQLAESICISPSPHASVFDHSTNLVGQKENIIPARPSGSFMSDPFITGPRPDPPKYPTPPQAFNYQPPQREQESDFFDPFSRREPAKPAKPAIHYPQAEGQQFAPQSFEQNYWPGFS